MKKKKVLKWPKGQSRLEFPIREQNCYVAIEKVREFYKLPKHKKIGFFMEEYLGENGFITVPRVYIER